MNNTDNKSNQTKAATAKGEEGTRNLAEQKRQLGDVVYYDRGQIKGQDNMSYERYAIKTHFIMPGEDQAELVSRYVKPLYQPGDVLSFGAKVMGMCAGTVRTREQVKPGFWANLLWRFAGHNSTGIGMHEPYKLQLVVEQVGLPKVLWAAFLSALTKPFGKKGVFYEVCGQGVGGIDGFYPDSGYEFYHNMAVLKPPNARELCNSLALKTAIPIVLMDANDFQRDQLGKSDNFPLNDQQIQDALRDNPSGQGREQTPFILIRPVKETE